MNSINQFCPDKKMISAEHLFKKDVSYELDCFDEQTIAFFNEVSSVLLKNKLFNRNPEIVSLGFWLRKSNILSFKKENNYLLENKLYYLNPVGQVFHVAPSNVDTIFLYSICISLLMGNRNIVRVSSRSTPVVDFIIDSMNAVLAKKEFNVFKEYINIITYGHDDELSRYFSEHVDCRVIWGGDNTVKHFKAMPTRVHTKDIFFPNRISYSVFNASQFNKAKEEEKKQAANNFFNDAYVFDQMGCSSPKIIYVLGTVKEKEIFIDSFYKYLNLLTKEKYKSQAAALSSLKFNVLVDDVIGHELKNVIKTDNSIYLIEVEKEETLNFNCGGGYFYIKHIAALEEIKNDIHHYSQTLAYFGISEKELIALDKVLKGKGVDRIVPIGQALAFSYIWDGMNLLEAFSRKRRIELK